MESSHFPILKFSTKPPCQNSVVDIKIEHIEQRNSLRPYHPERARSRLISEAKQGQAWLALGWENKGTE